MDALVYWGEVCWSNNFKWFRDISLHSCSFYAFFSVSEIRVDWYTVLQSKLITRPRNWGDFLLWEAYEPSTFVGWYQVPKGIPYLIRSIYCPGHDTINCLLCSFCLFVLFESEFLAGETAADSSSSLPAIQGGTRRMITEPVIPSKNRNHVFKMENTI
jgi:hypothetical protein